MAKKPKKGASEDRVIQVLPETALRALMKKLSAAWREAKDCAASIKEIVADAVNKKHAHKGALGLFLKLDKMRPDNRSELLHHFDHYRACSDWDDQLDLFRKKAAEAPTDEADPSDVRGNGHDEEEYATAH